MRIKLTVAAGLSSFMVLAGCSNDSALDLATTIADEVGTSVPEKGDIEATFKTSGIVEEAGMTEQDLKEMVDFSYYACKRVEDGDWKFIESEVNSKWGVGSSDYIFMLLTIACPTIMAENT